MTREEVKELLPIIQAFAEGKTIECSNQDKQWVKIDYPIWTNNCKYRIKPEPKYKPFNTKEECWNEMLKHQPFGWVKEISSGILYLINSILDSGIAIMEDVDIFEEAINSYEFKDGTPFGIKEK